MPRCVSYQIFRTPKYIEDLQSIEQHIAQDNRLAAIELWLHIDEQTQALSDPKFPRRTGRVPGTWELVAHKNYVVVLLQDDTQCTVTVLRVLHAAQQYPSRSRK